MKVTSLILTVLAVAAAIGGTQLADRVDDSDLVAALRERIGTHAESLKEAADRRESVTTDTSKEVRTVRDAARDVLALVEKSADGDEIDADRLTATLEKFLASARGLNDDKESWQETLDDFEAQTSGDLFAEWKDTLESLKDPDLKRYHESLFAKYRRRADQESERLGKTIGGLDQSLARAEDVGRALKSLQLAQQARKRSGDLANTADSAAARVREFIADTDRVLKLLGS